MDTPPTPREQLEQLLPPAPPLDTATVGTGLGDAAARLSVALLLTRTRTAA
ncbi:MAG: hypothetical protein JWO60_2693 [Frankiales bacterium]|nr:hypothetical protein [Frankiales bacterium]